MDVIGRRIAAAAPETNGGLGVTIDPLQSYLVGADLRVTSLARRWTDTGNRRACGLGSQPGQDHLAITNRKFAGGATGRNCGIVGRERADGRGYSFSTGGYDTSGHRSETRHPRDLLRAHRFSRYWHPLWADSCWDIGGCRTGRHSTFQRTRGYFRGTCSQYCGECRDRARFGLTVGSRATHTHTLAPGES